MNILFICKFNRFRSKVAEAVFNKLNKNPNNKAKSAGIIRGRPLDKVQVAVAKKMGYNINSKPRGLTSEMLIWNNYTIIVADDIPKNILKDNAKYGKGLKVWKIPDVESNDEKEIAKTISLIEKKVEKLVKELK